MIKKCNLTVTETGSIDIHMIIMINNSDKDNGSDNDTNDKFISTCRINKKLSCKQCGETNVKVIEVVFEK